MSPPTHTYKRYRSRMPFNHPEMIAAAKKILSEPKYARPKELTAYFALPETYRETDKPLVDEVTEKTGIKIIYPFDYDPKGGMRPDAVPFDLEQVMSTHLILRHIPNASIGATEENSTAKYFQKPVLVYASGERFFTYSWVLEYADNVDHYKDLWIRRIHLAKIMFDALDKKEDLWNPAFKDFLNHYRSRIDESPGKQEHLEEMIDKHLSKGFEKQGRIYVPREQRN